MMEFKQGITLAYQTFFEKNKFVLWHLEQPPGSYSPKLATERKSALFDSGDDRETMTAYSCHPSIL